MTQNNIGCGNVEIDLVGHGKLELKPTLEAAIKLTSKPGGITKMIQRCMDFEFQAIQEVIVVGLGDNSKDLPQLIYQTGLFELASPCITYLQIIANGGRPVDEDATEDKKDGDSPLVNSSL